MDFSQYCLPEAAPDPLSELGRATTAYHDAPPDQIEQARTEYESALRRFKSASLVSERTAPVQGSSQY
jgi:hypothetical protein